MKKICVTDKTTKQEKYKNKSLQLIMWNQWIKRDLQDIEILAH